MIQDPLGVPCIIVEKEPPNELTGKPNSALGRGRWSAARTAGANIGEAHGEVRKLSS